MRELEESYITDTRRLYSVHNVVKEEHDEESDEGGERMLHRPRLQCRGPQSEGGSEPCPATSPHKGNHWLDNE